MKLIDHAATTLEQGDWRKSKTDLLGLIGCYTCNIRNHPRKSSELVLSTFVIDGERTDLVGRGWGAMTG